MQPNHEPLNIDEIKKITGCKKIHYFESVNSTNSWLLENGKCKDICISETQSAGRGRRGNTWVSPKGGNIYFSQCWCFDEATENFSLLGLVAGIAIAESLSDIGLTGHGVKWPNDIFYQNKKLGGILLETKDQSGKVVLGIGLNITLPVDIVYTIGQAAISVNDILKGGGISREMLIINLIKRLSKRLTSFHSLDFEDFIKLWKYWDILQGRKVFFNHQGLLIKGVVKDIDKYGRLGIINNLSGELKYYSSADIKLMKEQNSQ